MASPVGEASRSSERFDCAPVGDRSMVRLTSWLPAKEFDGPIEWQGRPLPGLTGDVLGGDPRVLCTSPQEWLLIFTATDVVPLRNLVAPDLARHSLALIDLTAALTVFELRGSKVRDVLRKSCALDVEGEDLATSRCARTRFANIPVLIDCIRFAELYEIYVVRSYAAYLQSWLTDAGSQA
jgi:heterotetrameric sarcosine oxidase gamma subunit